MMSVKKNARHLEVVSCDFFHQVFICKVLVQVRLASVL